MKVPYATCDFAAIRRENYFYVDKTPFLPHIESTSEKHVIFLRPRRFGKSTTISTLGNYYDIVLADCFDELFSGLWIHQNPTPNRNKYLVLTLDFSPVDTMGTMAQICKSFSVQVKAAVRSFIHRYVKLVPELAELNTLVRSDTEDMAALMTELLTRIADAGHQMYLLIDEYDHFGNRLLSDDRKTLYQELVQSSGFVRSFYASLKAFTRTSTIARTFITGVSPIMLDDLSSGFNIITHISLDNRFHALTGFTRAEVELAVDTLLRDNPQWLTDPRLGDRAQLLDVLERYYDGYRFSKNAPERMYNSTLVLHFLRSVIRDDGYPERMLDLNVRTDYGRLYALVTAASGQDTGARELLEEVLLHERLDTPLVEQFGTALPLGRAQIASLFYYMGMLTFAPDAATQDTPRLVIPNRVMRELQWSYMSMAMAMHDHIKIDMTDIELGLNTMAKTGDVQPFVNVFKKQVIERISNKDLMKFDEKTMKLMLMAYVCQTQVFYVASELELHQGYCDLLLGLRRPNSVSKYAWIIEAKYVKTNAKPEAIDKVVEEGYQQIDRYVADEGIVRMLTLGNELKAGVLVFVGLKRIEFRAWPRPAKEASATKKSGAKARKKS